ncbi:MAG: hypothetical protein IJW97_01730 [Clostridia bacterium]|nr:hypothetical protein [Clostridia bacterium]
MDFKNNINYFKKSDTPKFVGMGMMVVGVLLLWLGMSYITYILSAVLIPIGLVLFFIGASGRAGDSEIDAFIKRRVDGMEVDLSEDRAYAKRILKHIPPQSIEDYEYREGLMLTKAKNSSLRSSEYTRSLLYILSDALYIPVRTISLVEDHTDNKLYEIPYDMISGIEITRERRTLPFGKQSFSAKITKLCITYGDSLTLSLPIHDDVGADRLVETIQKVMQDYQKAQKNTEQ